MSLRLLVQGILEDGYDRGVESAAGAAVELGQGLHLGTGRLIGACGRHRIKGVDGKDNARAERDVLPSEFSRQTRCLTAHREEPTDQAE